MSRPKITRDDETWLYQVEGIDGPVPSVTDIIKATVPKDLAWWGMQVACDGIATMLPYTVRVSGEQLVAELAKRNLTTNDVMKKGGARGTFIHKVLEKYARTGEIPEPGEHALYSQALAHWLLDTRPHFMDMEVMTASLEYRYAGTFDLRCMFEAGKYKNKTCLVDIKTSKHIYKDQFFPQVEAYEHAEVELGEAPTDLRLVVRLGGDGKYSEAVSSYTFEDFRVLLEHFNAIQSHKKRGKYASYKAKSQ